MEANKYPYGRSLRVFWVDSNTRTGWCYEQEGFKPDHIVSLGYVVEAGTSALTLTCAIAARGGAVSPVTIPWEAIIKIDELPEDWNRL